MEEYYITLPKYTNIHYHENCRRAEENTDALLDGEKESDDETDKKKQSSQDDIDETVAKRKYLKFLA